MNDPSENIGSKNRNFKIGCFAFADDLTLLVESKTDTVAQVEELTGIAQKATLHVSFIIKGSYCIKLLIQKTEGGKKFGKINNTNYLEEIISRK